MQGLREWLDEDLAQVRVFSMAFPGVLDGFAAGKICDEVLFVGPAACYHHNRGIGGDKTSALCLSDAQMAAGMSEDLVFEALSEIASDDSRPVESVMLLSACQSAFVGTDFDTVARRACDELGIICVHGSNCRIMLSGERDRGLVRDTVRSSNALYELVDLMPDCPSGESAVLLVCAGVPFDEQNELFSAARDWGFDGVQTLADWRSREGLSRSRDAGYVLSVGDGQATLAGMLGERWNVPFDLFQPTYRIDEVDARYEYLNKRFGKRADVVAARAAAVRAVERAVDLLGDVGSSLDLMGFSHPWRALHDLYDMGLRFAELNVGWRTAGFDGSGPLDDDCERFLADYPEARGTVATMSPQQRQRVFEGGAPLFLHMPPNAEQEYFGYRLIEACMDRISDEVERGRHEGAV